MGKKRRAISAPQKHRVRARILGVNTTAKTSNSEAIEELKASNNTTNEVPTSTPTVEVAPEPVVVAETTNTTEAEAPEVTTTPEPPVVKTAPKTAKTTRTRTTAKKKTTRTRRTTTKKTDSSEA